MSRVKRPAFQFYPGDWQRDTALRSCSLAARGLWIEMLCLMHEGEPYGHLLVGAKVIDAATLARMVGEPARKVAGWLAELEAAGVLSRTEAGVIYSRRMVRDEHIRQVRAAAGKLGGNPALMGNPPATSLDVDAGDLDKQPDIQTAKQAATPAVASAPAGRTQLPTTTTAGVDEARVELLAVLPADYGADLDDLLARTPGERHLPWLRSLLAKANGLHPPLAPPAVLGEAIRQFNTNGETNWRRFEGYVRDLAEGRTPTPKQSPTDRGATRRGERTPPPRYAYANATTSEDDVVWTS